MIDHADWLAYQTLIRPRHPALIQGDQHWTYAELNELVTSLAARLATAGVRAGQHVAVLMPNRIEYISLIHALIRLEAVLVPLNIRLTPIELRWQLEQANCQHLVCSRETEAQAIALGQGDWRTLSVEPAADTVLVSLPALPANHQEQWRGRLNR